MAISLDVNTFVRPPSPNDRLIYIYNSDNVVVMAIDPYSSIFYNKGQYVYIVTDDKLNYNNVLDFGNDSNALLAVAKLDDIKKTFIDSVNNNLQESLNLVSKLEYYTHTANTLLHINSGISYALRAANNPSDNNPFVTIDDISTFSGDTKQVKISGNDIDPGYLIQKLTGSSTIDLTILNDGANEILEISAKNITTSLSGLSDVNIMNISNGQYLKYNNGQWNNYDSAHTNNWVDINNTPTTIHGYDITDAYTTAQTYTKIEIEELIAGAVFTGSTGSSTLYYTRSQVDSFLLGKSDTGHTHSLSGLTDVNLNNIQNNDLIIYSGTTWNNLSKDVFLIDYYNKTQVYNTGETISVSGGSIIGDLFISGNTVINNTYFDWVNNIRIIGSDGIGFGEDHSQLKFTNSSRTFEIYPDNPSYSSYTWYYKGILHEISLNKSLVISNTIGSHFIYFDENEDLQEVVNPSTNDIINLVSGKYYTVLVAMCHWNGFDCIILNSEKHTAQRNISLHLYHHFNDGLKHQSGSNLSGYTLDDDNINSITFSLTDSVYYDEDIRMYSVNSNTPTKNFEQQLNVVGVSGESVARMPIFYLSGDTLNPIWVKDNATDYITKNIENGRVSYNYNDGVNWTQVECTDNYYTFSYIFETSDTRHPIFVIQGQGEYLTSTNAQNASLELLTSLRVNGMPSYEMKCLYIVVIQTSNSFYNNERKYKLIKINDQRSNSTNVVFGTDTLLNSHNNLANLLGGDVDNYYHLTNTHYNILVNSFDASGLHNHDTFYYTKNQIDNTLTGITNILYSHTGNTNNPHLTSINQLIDTTITGLTQNDFLVFSGTTWINTNYSNVISLYTKDESDYRFIHKTGDTLTGDLIINTLTGDSAIIVANSIGKLQKIDTISYKITASSISGITVIDLFGIDYGKGVTWDYVIDNTLSYRFGTIRAVWDGVNIEFDETSTKDIGSTRDFIFYVDILNNNIRLISEVFSDLWEVTIRRTVL